MVESSKAPATNVTALPPRSFPFWHEHIAVGWCAPTTCAGCPVKKKQQPAPAKQEEHQEQEIPRSISWESWSSSLTSLSDLHDDKRTWSFKDDYVSFPSLADDVEKEHEQQLS
ncbi:hypothetical protein BJV82DRAFT_666188 [Fennellomyces sp. T-0311]|nr:hypothetical protein BJV82DRAFT_666188 [Fennellomyces sp. T-0311]